MSNNKYLAIIPARGGSKGIPDKNITLLAGKPLISYTCKAAKECPLIGRTIVSTDSKKIADVARLYKAETPFLRPTSISQDNSTALEVILHALDFLKNEKNPCNPVAVIYLQPTSPLRNTCHIHEAIKLFEKTKNADTLVSVTHIPHIYHPLKLMVKSRNYLSPYIDGQGTKILNRHAKMPLLYARNGPSILIVKTSIIRKKKSLYGDKIIPYVMSHEDSVDIDEPWHIKLAEFFLKNRNL